MGFMRRRYWIGYTAASSRRWAGEHQQAPENPAQSGTAIWDSRGLQSLHGPAIQDWLPLQRRLHGEAIPTTESWLSQIASATANPKDDTMRQRGPQECARAAGGNGGQKA